jgi:hypothetical protein
LNYIVIVIAFLNPDGSILATAGGSAATIEECGAKAEAYIAQANQPAKYTCWDVRPQAHAKRK